VLQQQADTQGDQRHRRVPHPNLVAPPPAAAEQITIHGSANRYRGIQGTCTAFAPEGTCQSCSIVSDVEFIDSQRASACGSAARAQPAAGPQTRTQRVAAAAPRAFTLRSHDALPAARPPLHVLRTHLVLLHVRRGGRRDVDPHRAVLPRIPVLVLPLLALLRSSLLAVHRPRAADEIRG